MDRFWEENLDGIRKWKAEALANHHCMNEWQLTLVYVLERHDTLEARVKELIGIGETQTHNLHKINADVLRLEAENERLREALVYIESKAWFDKSKDISACIWCDMGGAGEKRNDDGHDKSCPASVAHYALAALEKGEVEK